MNHLTKLSAGRVALIAALAAAGSVNVALADFKINAVKTDDGTTDVVELYMANDGLHSTGTGLESYELTYNGTPTPFYYNHVVDIYNHDRGPNFSSMRVHPNIDTPFRVSPVSNDPAWANPITGFTITYAALGETDLPGNVGLGAPFARLVIPDGGSFTMAGRVGGDIGNVGLASVSQNYFIANIAPRITGGGVVASRGTGGEGGATSLGAGTITRHLSAVDPDGLLRTFNLQDLNSAAAKGFAIDRTGSDGFDVSWDPSVVPAGTYNFGLTAVDSSIQSNSTTLSSLQIVVAPEPATAALALGALLMAARRR